MTNDEERMNGFYLQSITYKKKKKGKKREICSCDYEHVKDVLKRIGKKCLGASVLREIKRFFG